MESIGCCLFFTHIYFHLSFSSSHIPSLCGIGSCAFASHRNRIFFEVCKPAGSYENCDPFASIHTRSCYPLVLEFFCAHIIEWLILIESVLPGASVVLRSHHVFVFNDVIIFAMEKTDKQSLPYSPSLFPLLFLHSLFILQHFVLTLFPSLSPPPLSLNFSSDLPSLSAGVFHQFKGCIYFSEIHNISVDATLSGTPCVVLTGTGGGLGGAGGGSVYKLLCKNQGEVDDWTAVIESMCYFFFLFGYLILFSDLDCIFLIFNSQGQRISAQNSVQSREHEMERNKAPMSKEQERESKFLIKTISENFGSQRYTKYLKILLLKSLLTSYSFSLTHLSSRSNTSPSAQPPPPKHSKKKFFTLTRKEEKGKGDEKGKGEEKGKEEKKKEDKGSLGFGTLTRLKNFRQNSNPAFYGTLPKKSSEPDLASKAEDSSLRASPSGSLSSRSADATRAEARFSRIFDESEGSSNNPDSLPIHLTHSCPDALTSEPSHSVTRSNTLAPSASAGASLSLTASQSARRTTDAPVSPRGMKCKEEEREKYAREREKMETYSESLRRPLFFFQVLNICQSAASQQRSWKARATQQHSDVKEIQSVVEQKYKEIEEKQEEKKEERRTSLAGVPPGLAIPLDHRRAMSVITPPTEEELRGCLTDRSRRKSLRFMLMR